MAACAYCNATILFGGRRVGEYQYCSTHHALLGRSLVQAAEASEHGGVRELNEELIALADEVERQRVALADAQERIDFLERALVQLRDAAAKRP